MWGCWSRPASDASFMNCCRLLALMTPPMNRLASSTFSATTCPEKVSSAL